VTTGAPRVVLLRHEGEVYTPVMTNGRVLDLADLQALASAPSDRPEIVRRLYLVLLDETELDGGWHYDVAALASGRRLVRIPLALGDSQVPIGELESIVRHPPDAFPGVVGGCLAAVARLAASRLADVAWTGIQDGVLGGLCVELTGEDLEPGQIERVRLGDRGSGHVPGAKVLASWQEPWPDAEDDEDGA